MCSSDLASPRKERLRKQKENNATGQRDDVHTEGQVLEIRRGEAGPVLVIAGGDGVIELRLRGAALGMLERLRVGDYVTAEGEKQHEGLYDADEVGIEN